MSKTKSLGANRSGGETSGANCPGQGAKWIGGEMARGHNVQLPITPLYQFWNAKANTYLIPNHFGPTNPNRIMPATMCKTPVVPKIRPGVCPGIVLNLLLLDVHSLEVVVHSEMQVLLFPGDQISWVSD